MSHADTTQSIESQLIERLKTLVGADQVIVDPALVSGYATDWTRRFHGPCTGVVRPADVTQVAAVVRACADVDVPVVPQGGNTSLVGGSVPGPPVAGRRSPVIVSTQRLRALGPVDVTGGQVTVDAGVTIAELRRHARAHDLEYGVDLSARDSATVGGTIATNAGGVRVCAFGTTRAQVLGVQAVLADGSVIEHLGGLVKDNSGYDLASLLTGSEGTLGVVTAARVRLHPRPGPGVVVLMGISSYDEGLEVVAEIRRARLRLLAAEVMDAEGVRLVCQVAGLSWPLTSTDHAHLLLIEIEETTRGAALDELAAILARHDEVADLVVGADPTAAARLWSYRERQTEAVSSLGVVHKLDVSVPVDRLQEFSDGLARLLTGAEGIDHVVVFGHLAEANLHIELAGPEPDDYRADEAILRWAARCGGSISAEHGIGRAKTGYLPLCRSAADLAAMAAVKRALDPRGLMNPGTIFP